MRADMAKVIVERPRIGSRIHGKPKGYRRARCRLKVIWTLFGTSGFGLTTTCNPR